LTPDLAVSEMMWETAAPDMPHYHPPTEMRT